MEQPNNGSQSDNKLVQKELIGLALFILLSTGLVIWGFSWSFSLLNAYQIDEKVEWPNSDSIQLNNVPIWFLHDSSYIYSLKRIDPEDKILLLSLLARDTLAFPTYAKAVDKLTFKTNKSSRIPFEILLLIGGFSAAIGVKIRTMFNFIGRACYKKDIELLVWWPWYLIRPFLGFVIGGVILVFFESGIINSLSHYQASNLLLIGVTVLAGFGVIDVVDLLRNLSKKIFGTEK